MIVLVATVSKSSLDRLHFLAPWYPKRLLAHRYEGPESFPREFYAKSCITSATGWWLRLSLECVGLAKSNTAVTTCLPQLYFVLLVLPAACFCFGTL